MGLCWAVGLGIPSAVIRSVLTAEFLLPGSSWCPPGSFLSRPLFSQSLLCLALPAPCSSLAPLALLRAYSALGLLRLLPTLPVSSVSLPTCTWFQDASPVLRVFTVSLFPAGTCVLGRFYTPTSLQKPPGSPSQSLTRQESLWPSPPAQNIVES